MSKKAYKWQLEEETADKVKLICAMYPQFKPSFGEIVDIAVQKLDVDTVYKGVDLSPVKATG